MEIGEGGPGTDQRGKGLNEGGEGGGDVSGEYSPE